MSEEIKKAEELTDEVLEQVAGGINEPEVHQAKCPECKFSFYYRSAGNEGPSQCPNCGYKFPGKSDVIIMFDPDSHTAMNPSGE